MADPAQLPYLLQLLDDDSLRVQKAVAAALGDFGPALDEHLAQLPEPPSAIQKRQIHELLGFSGSDPVAASTAEAEPLFRPGQLVQHSRYKYRGVVVGYDLSCQADEDWYASNRTRMGGGWWTRPPA